MNNKKLKKLGINIKNRRKSLGLSQEKLAEHVNKSRNYIGMVERAEVNIPILSLIEISQALNIKTKDLLDF